MMTELDKLLAPIEDQLAVAANVDRMVAQGVEEGYGRALRAAARAAWLGVFDEYQFFEAMDAAFRFYLTRAFHDGAKECGIMPNELSPEERMALDGAVIGERDHALAFYDYIVKIVGTKDAGGKWATVAARVETWAIRYRDVLNLARLLTCADKKLKWVLGMTTEHCSSCLKLAGKVKRASYWHENGIRPQNPPNPLLECGGYGCLCELLPTDEPMSRGPLPGLP